MKVTLWTAGLVTYTMKPAPPKPTAKLQPKNRPT